MGARSTIERDPAVREAVDTAISRGATIDEIVDHVRGLGAGVSRSAVGRYTKNYAELAKQQRDIRAAASAFANDFGSADDGQTRLIVQLVTSIATRVAMDASTAGEGDERAITTTKQLADFARTAKDLAQAASIDERRMSRVREEAARQARQEAADAAEETVKAAGASAETIRKVRASILGIAA